MRMDLAVKRRIIPECISKPLDLCAAALLMFAWLSLHGETPWSHPAAAAHPAGPVLEFLRPLERQWVSGIYLVSV